MSEDQANSEAARLNRITETIIGCAYKVGSTLGPGFLEKVYENALCHELRKAGLRADQQRRLTVWYDGVVVGDYTPGAFVEDAVIVEVKAVRAVEDAHVAQGIHYLAATRLPICLLLNFSRRVEVKRLVGPAAPPFPPHLGSSGPSVAS